MVFTGMGTQTEHSMEVEVTGDGTSFLRTMDESLMITRRFRIGVGLLGGALTALGAGAMAYTISQAREWNGVLREIAKVTDPMQADAIGEAIIDVSERLPLATAELGRIAEEAARFGIEGPENIAQFTEAVAEMAFATNISVEQAGQAFARLATLMRMPIDQVRNLGSSINTLGQTTATSSADIVDNLLRSAAALESLGLTESEMVGLAASLNAVSESSDRAGTRLRRLGMTLLEPSRMEALGQATGMTGEQFRAMSEEAPLDAILLLAETLTAGGEGADILAESIDARALQALRGLGLQLDDVRANIDRANTSFIEGTSIQEEMAIEMDSVGAKAQLLRNRIFNASAAIGGNFTPVIKNLLDVSTDLVQGVIDLNRETQGLIGTFGIVGVTATGVVLTLGAINPVLGALAAAVILLASAWATNFGGIRDVTNAFVSDVGGAFGRLFDVLNGFFKWFVQTNDAVLRDGYSSWDAFVVGMEVIIGLLDVGLTGLAQTFDAVVTAIEFGAARAAAAWTLVQETIEGADPAAAARRYREAVSEANQLLTDFEQRRRQRRFDLTQREIARGERIETIRMEGAGPLFPTSNIDEAASEFDSAIANMDDAAYAFDEVAAEAGYAADQIEGVGRMLQPSELRGRLLDPFEEVDVCSPVAQATEAGAGRVVVGTPVSRRAAYTPREAAERFHESPIIDRRDSPYTSREWRERTHESEMLLSDPGETLEEEMRRVRRAIETQLKPSIRLNSRKVTEEVETTQTRETFNRLVKD